MTAEMKLELAALEARMDEATKLLGVPSKNRKGVTYVGLFPAPSLKKSVTIRLDGDVVKWFKGQGKGWQTKMNWVLRLYYASHRKTGVKVGRP